MKTAAVYKVERLKGPFIIDGNWYKYQWERTASIDIENYMGEIPAFRPEVRAKMMYDDESLYVIFHVDDRYVRCITNKINGPVWEDSCVEFFFSPDARYPEKYFNLEINCGGTPLMHYNIIPRKKSIEIGAEDIKQIQIAHTLPAIVEPEITERVFWTIEYRLPIALLKKYSAVTDPGKGIEWRANFYKCAEKNSNPHFMTWAIVENEKPDFHLPGFFGTLIFQ